MKNARIRELQKQLADVSAAVRELSAQVAANAARLQARPTVSAPASKPKGRNK